MNKATHVKVVNKSGLPQILTKQNWDNINLNNVNLASTLEYLHECDENGIAVSYEQETKQEVSDKLEEFENLLTTAGEHMEKKEYSEAKECLNKALEISPKSKIAQKFLSDVEEYIANSTEGGDKKTDELTSNLENNEHGKGQENGNSTEGGDKKTSELHNEGDTGKLEQGKGKKESKGGGDKKTGGGDKKQSGTGDDIQQ